MKVIKDLQVMFGKNIATDYLPKDLLLNTQQHLNKHLEARVVKS